MAKITDLILDFDGTCTQIPGIYVDFLKDYLVAANLSLPASQQISSQTWENAKATVTKQSPVAGWTVAATPAAPAAADPYMLAYEAGKFILRAESSSLSIPPSVYATAYAAHPGLWRPETLKVIKAIHAEAISIHIVTNSDTATVKHRLQDLWGGEPLPATINVIGNANKFNINEPFWDTKIAPRLTELFNQVPAIQPGINIGRPLYLRRGSFFSVIASIFNDDPGRLATSLFCGDVWELDLALPAALGANIHLIERAAPFDTYPYERELTRTSHGKISNDLNGLLEWLK